MSENFLMDQSQTIISAGKSNDPSVAITSAVDTTVECRAILLSLGFTEMNGGSFVYNAHGRAIWVDSTDDLHNITEQIIQNAEAIGARTKINEIRNALDLPFEPLAVAEQPEQ